MYYTAIELFKYLSTDTLQKSFINNQHLDIQIPVINVEHRMNVIISNFSRREHWPVVRDRLAHFNNSLTGLPDLRLLHSDLMNHLPVYITSIPRAICPLCSLNGKHSKMACQCIICKVPLCITRNKGKHLTKPH